VWAQYYLVVEQKRVHNQAAALAGAVACEMNDELTVILNSLQTECPHPEDLAAVERATLRCACIARGLMMFAYRHGAPRRPGSVRHLLEDGLR
jgi:hypothetical protein